MDPVFDGDQQHRHRVPARPDRSHEQSRLLPRTPDQLAELAYALDSSSLRKNRAYARFFRTSLCEVHSPMAELTVVFEKLDADRPMTKRAFRQRACHAAENWAAGYVPRKRK